MFLWGGGGGGAGGANRVYYFEKCANDKSCVKACSCVADFFVCFFFNV